MMEMTSSTPTPNDGSKIYPNVSFMDNLRKGANYLLEDANVGVSDNGNIQLDIRDIEEREKETFAGNSSFVFSEVQNQLDHRDEVSSESSYVTISDFDDWFEKVPLNEIGQEHEGRVIRTEVQIQDVAESTSRNMDAVWECQNRHETTIRYPRWISSLEPPVQCGHDDCLDRPTQKKYNGGFKIDIQQLVLTETDKDDRNSRSLVGEVEKPLIGELERRDTVEVLTKVMMADRKNESKIKPYLWILGYEPVGHTVELNKKRKAELEERVEESSDIIEDLAESVAPQIVDRFGQKRAKKAVLCAMVKGGEHTDRNMIHTLFYGKRGSGKSKIMEFADGIAEVSHFVDAQQASKAGLTASAQQTSKLESEGESWIVTAGAIPQAHEGACFVDELDKADESIQMCISNPMSSGKVIKQTAGQANLQSETSIVVSANPEQETYQGDEPLMSLDIPIHVQDRFDLILRVDDEIQDREKEREVLEEISKRKKDEVDVPFSKDELKDYVAYAKRKDVGMTDKADEKIIDYILDLRMNFRQAKVNSLEMTGREQQKLTRLSSAMAKLRLGDEIKEIDVDRAWNLMLRGWQSVTFDALELEPEVVEREA